MNDDTALSRLLITARRRLVLVGGAGFIGHHLALHFANAGWDVLVVDDLQINNIGRVSASPASPQRETQLAVLHRRLELLSDAGVTLVMRDARDRGGLAALLPDLHDVVVVHLAAVAHADRSNREPLQAFESGLGSLASVLDLAREGVQRFVYFSSSMVYGDFNAPVADEEHPLRPTGVYGALKLAGETLVRTYQRVFDMPYTIIRPSALYGPRCISERVLERFLDRARRGVPLEIEGDGTEKVDFTFIDDLVAGTQLAIESDGARNETFNLTCGNARSLLELAMLVQNWYPTASITHALRDKTRPRRGTLSVDKARRLLGYEPRVQLEEGLRRCIQESDWAREQDNRRVPSGRFSSMAVTPMASHAEQLPNEIPSRG